MTVTTPLLLAVDNLTVVYSTPHGPITACRDVTFQVRAGECVGLWGRSGCGKSTLLRALLGILDGLPGWVNGTAAFHGRSISPAADRFVRSDGNGGFWKDVVGFHRSHRRLLRPIRGSRWRTVFQEPVYSFEPGRPIREQIRRIVAHEADRHGLSPDSLAQELDSILQTLGLALSGIAGLVNTQTSGGECQRLALALAMAGRPELILADEPTTAMDPDTRARAFALLRERMTGQGMAILLASHNLHEMRELADRIIVIYDGQIVEDIPKERFRRLADVPLHPYTRRLTTTAPEWLEGELPASPLRAHGEMQGCPYYDECPHPGEDPNLGALCRREKPPLFETTPTHRVACWLQRPEGAA